MGSWNGNNSGTDGFSHHADAINDGGWSTIRMANVVDGWIRRCAFVNVVRPIIISNTIAVSINQITVAGPQGTTDFCRHF